MDNVLTVRSTSTCRRSSTAGGDGNDGFAFDYVLPNWDQFSPQMPSIFALLSDPAMLVDGLDRVLGTLQGRSAARSSASSCRSWATCSPTTPWPGSSWTFVPIC